MSLLLSAAGGEDVRPPVPPARRAQDGAQREALPPAGAGGDPHPRPPQETGQGQHHEHRAHARALHIQVNPPSFSSYSSNPCSVTRPRAAKEKRNFAFACQVPQLPVSGRKRKMKLKLHELIGQRKVLVSTGLAARLWWFYHMVLFVVSHPAGVTSASRSSCSA